MSDSTRSRELSWFIQAVIFWAFGTPVVFAQTTAQDSPSTVNESRPQLESASRTGHGTTWSAIDGDKSDEIIRKTSELLAEPTRLQPKFELRGRVETEAVFAQQSQRSKQTIGELVNGFGFRRVRLGAQGEIEKSASWVSEVELAGGNVRLRDVFVGVDALPGVRQVRVGHFREPFSLEGMTSSNFMTFLERSPMNVLAPARNWGVCGFWWADDERTLFTLGAFRDSTANNGQSIGNGNNWAYTARLTALAVDEKIGDEVRLLHIGGAFSHRIPQNGLINFTPRTASNLLTVEDNPGSPYLPTVDIFANNFQLYNLQAGGVHGSFSVQGEWTAAQVQQTAAGGLFVHGAYVAASYFLTGEHRGYNRTRGSFDAVEVLRPFLRERSNPRSGFGAVELTTRLSFVDLDSPNLPLDVNRNPANTRLYEATLGANWYLNRSTRIMLNYTAAIPEKMTTTVAHTLGLRTAIYW